jgi:serine protease Do
LIPAAAGIKPGDVVVKVDGKDVTPDQTLSYIVANTAPGKRIPVEVIRNGQHLTLTATVGKRPSEDELAANNFNPDDNGQDDSNPFQKPAPEAQKGVVEQSLGLSVIPLTPQIAGQLGVPPATHGVVVNAVDPNSDAGGKGLQRGDIILSANYTNTSTRADLEAAVKATKAAGRNALLVQVQRRGQPAVYIPIRLR